MATPTTARLTLSMVRAVACRRASSRASRSSSEPSSNAVNSPPSAPRLRGLRLNERARRTMFTCFLSLSGVAERLAAERCRSWQVHTRVDRPRHTFEEDQNRVNVSHQKVCGSQWC